MSLAPLNRDPKYMSGDYANMFNIPVHAGNVGFATNPHSAGTCHPGDAVCFSLTQGAIPCKHTQDSLLVWRASGDLTSLQIRRTVAPKAA